MLLFVLFFWKSFIPFFFLFFHHLKNIKRRNLNSSYDKCTFSIKMRGRGSQFNYSRITPSARHRQRRRHLIIIFIIIVRECLLHSDAVISVKTMLRSNKIVIRELNDSIWEMFVGGLLLPWVSFGREQQGMKIRSFGSQDLKIVTQPFPAWANISYTHIHWKSFSVALDCFPIRISRSDPLADISFNQIDLILSLYELKAFVWEVSWRKVIKMSPNLLYKRKEIPLLSSSDHSIKSPSMDPNGHNAIAVHQVDGWVTYLEQFTNQMNTRLISETIHAC